MALENVLREECIRIKSRARTKTEVLQEIGELAAECRACGTIDRDTVVRALMEREKLGSTGFHDGVAIPHCSLESAKDFVVGVVTHEGIDFESHDGAPTRILAFIIGPKDRRSEHVRLLAALSRVLGDPESIREISASPSPEALRESVLRRASGGLEEKDDRKRAMIHVVVQKEGLFGEILSSITELDECSVSVIETNDASSYLTGLPLFAGFWSEKKRSFQRIIIAVVRHSLANEVVRRISTIAGENQRGIMISVQELLYCQGTIDL